MIGLDLFSGYGGITLALMPWVRPVAYCERERYCQAVLISRMAGGELPRAPIWDDVTTLKGSQFRGAVDIIYGGFPCQDISCAGRGEGLGGKRSGLFFEIVRLAKEIQPTFLFLENVPAIRTRGLDRVVRELADLGYDCRWDHLSAFDVGAPHKRDRWFLLAYADGSGRERTNAPQSTRRKRDPFPSGSGDVGNTNIQRLEIREPRKSREQPTPFRTSWWESEPDVGRVASRTPFRMDRVKAIGNGVVPLQARKAFMRLMGLGDGEQ